MTEDLIVILCDDDISILPIDGGPDDFAGFFGERVIAYAPESAESDMKPQSWQVLNAYTVIKSSIHMNTKTIRPRKSRPKPGYLTSKQARDLFSNAGLPMSMQTIAHLAIANLIRSYKSHSGKNARWFLNEDDVRDLVKRGTSDNRP